jgi:hypothetical protein
VSLQSLCQYHVVGVVTFGGILRLPTIRSKDSCDATTRCIAPEIKKDCNLGSSLTLPIDGPLCKALDLNGVIAPVFGALVKAAKEAKGRSRLIRDGALVLWTAPEAYCSLDSIGDKRIDVVSLGNTGLGLGFMRLGLVCTSCLVRCGFLSNTCSHHSLSRPGGSKPAYCYPNG